MVLSSPHEQPERDAGGFDPDFMRRKEAMYGEAARRRAAARELGQAMSLVARSGLPVAGATNPVTGKSWEHAGRSVRELRERRDAAVLEALRAEDEARRIDALPDPVLASSSPTYWCKGCKGPHGGMYSRHICHVCVERNAKEIEVTPEQYLRIRRIK